MVRDRALETRNYKKKKNKIKIRKRKKEKPVRGLPIKAFRRMPKKHGTSQRRPADAIKHLGNIPALAETNVRRFVGGRDTEEETGTSSSSGSSLDVPTYRATV